MDPIEHSGERLTDETRARHERKAERRKREFLKGPIPLDWIIKANALAGQALAVGLAIWFIRGLKRKGAIRLNPATLLRFDLPRTTTYRALRALEAAKLVTVDRHRGRSPVITILDVDRGGDEPPKPP